MRLLVVLLMSSAALAQEIPPPLVAPSPPKVPLEKLDKFERNAQQNKDAGAWMMGAGLVLNLIGGVIAATSMTNRREVCNPYWCSEVYNAPGMVYGGFGAVFVGQALLAAGMPIFFVGRAHGKQAKAARAALTASAGGLQLVF